jgi:hypothetical protein
MSSNSLCVEGTKLLAKAIECNQTMTSLNISSNAVTYDGKKSVDMSGVAALTDVLPTMGALTSLNFSSNDLRAEGSKFVAEAIKVTSCVIAVVLAPFSCPSDHWLNCCCLLLSAG